MKQSMDIYGLLREARSVWGDHKLRPEEMVIRMGVVLGDMNRIVRSHQEKGVLDSLELKKEMGNTIFSMVRWCDDLGFDPQECINLAKQAQQDYVQKNKK